MRGPGKAGIAAAALLALASSAADDLAHGGLLFPLPASHQEGLRDSFGEKRGTNAHEAVDIMAPRGTPVYAVDGGRVAKLFKSVPGGNTLYQFDPSGRYAYYYAHLDRYANGLVEGKALARGEVVGYVGSTGNAAQEAPHLHFAIFRLGPERQWWKGEAIDPYPYLSTPTRPAD